MEDNLDMIDKGVENTPLNEKIVDICIEADLDNNSDDLKLLLDDVFVDEVGQLIIPHDSDYKFTRSQLIQCDENTESRIGDGKATIKIQAHMMSEQDTDNFDYFTNIDPDTGDIVVTPDDQKVSFITAALDDNLNLAEDVLVEYMLLDNDGNCRKCEYKSIEEAEDEARKTNSRLFKLDECDIKNLNEQLSNDQIELCEYAIDIYESHLKEAKKSLSVVLKYLKQMSVQVKDNLENNLDDMLKHEFRELLDDYKNREDSNS